MKSLCSIRVLGNPLPFAVGRCCVDNFDQCIQENVCVVESMMRMEIDWKDHFYTTNLWRLFVEGL